MAKKKTKKDRAIVRRLVFTRENYWIFFAGIFLILLGYILMAAGDTYSTLSITIAPIILFIAYLIVIPVAILYSKKSPEDKHE